MKQKTRLQIPVSRELADYVTQLGECFRWKQAIMSAALLEEGLKSRKKVEQWLSERVIAAIVNTVRRKRKASAIAEPVVYIQTFVDDDVLDSINRMAGELKNSPARTAALVLESAAFDNGWVIETLGSGPGQAVLKFFKDWKAKHSHKSGRVAPTG